jgi:hypothetical protein
MVVIGVSGKTNFHAVGVSERIKKGETYGEPPVTEDAIPG